VAADHFFTSQSASTTSVWPTHEPTRNRGPRALRTAGPRKIRLGDPTRGKGKRGGARVHYLWLPHRGRIYLLFVYGKNEASTLTADQKKKLREVVAQIKATDSPKE